MDALVAGKEWIRGESDRRPWQEDIGEGQWEVKV